MRARSKVERAELRAAGARAPSGLGVALATLALGLAVIGGCGPDRPPPEGSGSGTRPGASSGAQFNLDGGSTKPPGCGSTPDGAQCDCLDVPLFVDPPAIYFVLDRSGSMATSDKWTQVRITVGKIMRSLGPRASFGATMFPGSAPDACAPGEEIMSIRAGDPPSSSVDGPTTTTLLAATRVPPHGGTPTGPTLELVAKNLSRVTGRVFVILATDGAPNCNPQASCGFDQCQPNMEDSRDCPKLGPRNCCEPPDGYRENCNDAATTLAAISALKTAGIPVYVVGLPGAATYASLLDQMASFGGTALPSSPKYFAVDSASETLMLKTLKKIAAQIVGTCVFDLKEAPNNPSLVNVYMDDVVLPFEPVNGWTLEGKTVTLVGSACERVKNGDALDVRIIAGCPRLEPK